jgi:hypothetical protein
MVVISVWLAIGASALSRLRDEQLSIELVSRRLASVTECVTDSLSVTLLSVTVRMSVTA